MCYFTINGSTLSGANETFSWNSNGANVDGYFLYVGTTGVGSADVYSGYEGTATSKTFTDLPTDGNTIYFRFWYRVNGNWTPIDYTYTAASCNTTKIISPTPESTLSGENHIFKWYDGGENITKYWLYIGSNVGTKDIFDSGDLGTATSANISNLSMNSSTIYVRFWFYIGALPTNFVRR